MPNDRPVLLAHLVDGDEPAIRGLRSTANIHPGEWDRARELSQLANGHSTISELCAETNTALGEATEFFDQLEEQSICFKQSSLAMFSHNAANNPQVFSPSVSDDEIAQLMKLENDPSTAFVEFTTQPDPIDIARRSCRTFAAEPVRRRQLEQVLLAAYGMTRRTDGFDRRSVPSGGGMYPLVHHVFTLNVEGLASRHWRLGNHENALFDIGAINDDELRTAIFEDRNNAAVVHVIGFDLGRSSRKYGNRAYRLAMLEAGHSAQNAMRKATELKLGSWEIGGYLDDPLQDLCGLTTPDSGIATVLFYGNAETAD